MRWKQHAQQVHHGRDVEAEEIVLRCDATVQQYRHVERDIASVPSLMQTCRAYRAMQPRRAHGEDSLPPELYVSCAYILAQLMHPIITKAALTLGEPAAWRGGMLSFFPKLGTSADVTIPKINRDIFPAQVDANTFHRRRLRRLQAAGLF